MVCVSSENLTLLSAFSSTWWTISDTAFLSSGLTPFFSFLFTLLFLEEDEVSAASFLLEDEAQPIFSRFKDSKIPDNLVISRLKVCG
uniref:Uncharacterized protein n=1 Tax=Amphimedon queenslandica TaxID=400682 RepID=A0A1X7UD85_AMPQE